MLQDDPIKEVFQDEIETNYATTRQPYLELLFLHIVVVEHLEGFANIIRDKWANEFRTLDWLEIRAHMGQSIDDQKATKESARVYR